MKCDLCDMPAVVHTTQIHGGKQTMTHLCETCARSASGTGTVPSPREATQILKNFVEKYKNLQQFSINSMVHFLASHQLRLYDGSLEPLHEHDWVVKVTVHGPLDSIGVVMDFHDLEKRMAEVLNPMRGRSLNDLPPFAANNPSAENVAKHIGDTLSLPASVRLTRIEVWETPENSAVYQPSMRLPSTAR
jgi:6-pyruvoyltetrahydropterin/6-carboxytetrahydropterin synthase